MFSAALVVTLLAGNTHRQVSLVPVRSPSPDPEEKVVLVAHLGSANLAENWLATSWSRTHLPSPCSCSAGSEGGTAGTRIQCGTTPAVHPEERESLLNL